MIYEGKRNGVGYSMAIFDYDGDGLDDFLAAFNHLTLIKGNTGQVLMHRGTGWGEIFRVGTFRAEPIVADFVGNGRKQILCVRLLARNVILESLIGSKISS